MPKPINREELAKQVVQQDPSFSTVLEKYQALASRIDTYRRELALKRTSIEQSIDRLHKELQAAIAAVKKKVEDTKRLMAPERQEIVVALALAEEELRATRPQRMSVGRRIVQLRKAIKAPVQGTPAADKAKFEAQFNEAVEEAQRLDHEIDLIKDHIRLLKLKARLIEF